MFFFFLFRKDMRYVQTERFSQTNQKSGGTYIILILNAIYCTNLRGQNYCLCFSSHCVPLQVKAFSGNAQI